MGRRCLILSISPLGFKYGTVTQSYLWLGDGEREREREIMLAPRAAEWDFYTETSIGMIQGNPMIHS